MDAKKVVSALENKENILHEFTDKEGNKEKLFEIIKKYDIKNTDKPIGLGHAIDLYAAGMFEDGNYFTEYLVDIDFLKKDLLESCQLELIETDLYENQFNMHSSFFKDNIYKFEPNLETRDFLEKVSKYYEKNEINNTCYVFTNFWRFSIFRKKDSGQIGGKIDLSKLEKYSVPKMTDYDQDYSLQNSIHHVLKTHLVVPSTINENDLFNDINIKLIKDFEYDDKNIKKLLKNIIIEHELDNKDIKKVIDGIDICTFERNVDSIYKPHFITCDKKNAKIITMIKEGQLYKPLYIKFDNVKQALFESDDKLLNELIKSLN